MNKNTYNDFDGSSDFLSSIYFSMKSFNEFVILYKKFPIQVTLFIVSIAAFSTIKRNFSEMIRKFAIFQRNVSKIWDVLSLNKLLQCTDCWCLIITYD